MPVYSKLFTNLVLEGGGVRGVAFIGAIKALEELNLMNNIHSFAGSSAGAITACLLSIGLTSKQIKEEMDLIDFNEFKDDSLGFIRDFYRIYYNYGYYKGKAFEKFLIDVLTRHTDNKDITFQDIYDLYGNTLVVTGTNVNRHQTVYFYKSTFPDMPVRIAVRISMSIPLFFQAVKYDGEYYVDGGVLNNYPIWVFDGTYIGDPKAKICSGNNKWNTLGLKLMAENETASSQIYQGTTTITNVINFVQALISAMCTQIDRGHIRSGYWKRTITISTGKVTATQFDISNEQKQTLIMSGYNSAMEYFNKFEERYSNELAARAIQTWWRRVHSKSNIGIKRQISTLEK